jgi:hypothetical protein
MILIGCDFHTRFQQIAMLEVTTGELVERRLEHENGDAERFYSKCSISSILENLAWTSREVGAWYQAQRSEYPEQFKNGYRMVRLIFRLVGRGGRFIPAFLIAFCQRAGVIPGTRLTRVPHYYRPIGSLDLVDNAIRYA